MFGFGKKKANEPVAIKGNWINPPVIKPEAGITNFVVTSERVIFDFGDTLTARSSSTVHVREGAEVEITAPAALPITIEGKGHVTYKTNFPEHRMRDRTEFGVKATIEY